MRVFLFEDDMLTLFVRPKEQAYGLSDLTEIPKDLIDRYKAVEEEYKAVQRELREYWDDNPMRNI